MLVSCWRPLGWQDLILVPLVTRKVQFWTLPMDLHSLTYFILLIRLIKLLEEIMGEAENKSLIFTETKRRADELTRRMRRDGWVFCCFFFHCRQVSSWWFLLSDLMCRETMEFLVTDALGTFNKRLYIIYAYVYSEINIFFIDGLLCAFMGTNLSQKGIGS